MLVEEAFEEGDGGAEVVVEFDQQVDVVPGQILIAFIAKLRLYRFWRGEGLFAELLRILEKDGTTGLGGSRRALWIVGIGLA